MKGQIVGIMSNVICGPRVSIPCLLKSWIVGCGHGGELGGGVATLKRIVHSGNGPRQYALFDYKSNNRAEHSESEN